MCPSVFSLNYLLKNPCCTSMALHKFKYVALPAYRLVSAVSRYGRIYASIVIDAPIFFLWLLFSFSFVIKRCALIDAALLAGRTHTGNTPWHEYVFQLEFNWLCCAMRRLHGFLSNAICKIELIFFAEAVKCSSRRQSASLMKLCIVWMAFGIKRDLR